MSQTSQPRPAALARWLWAVALLVIAVVAVGGITRLTESGLSITEWKPVSGVLPPLTEAGWLAEFEKYKQIPEQPFPEENALERFQAHPCIDLLIFGDLLVLLEFGEPGTCRSPNGSW